MCHNGQGAHAIRIIRIAHVVHVIRITHVVRVIHVSHDANDYPNGTIWGRNNNNEA
jgi:hypothetical protein